MKRNVKAIGLLLLLLLSVSGLAQNSRWASGVVDFSSEYNLNSGWLAIEILGEPNVYPQYGDNEGAFTPLPKNDGQHFISVSFTEPIPISSIAIYETYGTGSIDSIFVSNPNTGQWELVFSKVPEFAGSFSRIFVANFPLTEFSVDSVKFSFDTDLFNSWEEFDALQVADYDLTPNEGIIYYDEFNTLNPNWTFLNGEESNYWTYGNIPLGGESSATGLYISNGENIFGYDNSVQSRSYLSREVSFPENYDVFVLEFDWTSRGEHYVGNDYDWMDVYLADTSNTPTPGSDFEETPLNSQLYNDNYVIRHEFIVLDNSYSGTIKNLVLGWRNDSSVGELPAFVTNIKISGYVKTPVTGILNAGQNYREKTLEQALARIYANGIGTGGVIIQLNDFSTSEINIDKPIEGLSSENPLVIETPEGFDPIGFSNYGYEIQSESTYNQRRSNHNYVLRLFDVGNITFRNINFYANPYYDESGINFNSNYSRAIYLSNTTNIKFENCGFYGTSDADPYYGGLIVLNTDFDGSNGIEEQNTETARISGGNTKVTEKSGSRFGFNKGFASAKIDDSIVSNSNLFLNNNYFELGGSAVYAENRYDNQILGAADRHSNKVSAFSVNESAVTNFNFSGNTVLNSSYGVNLAGATRVTIEKNSFQFEGQVPSIVPVFAADVSAIYLGDMNDSLIISKNEISGSFNHAIYVNHHSSVNSTDALVSNNVVSRTNSDFNHLISISNSPELVFVYNTIVDYNPVVNTTVYLNSGKLFGGNVISTDSTVVLDYSGVQDVSFNDFYSVNPILVVASGISYGSIDSLNDDLNTNEANANHNVSAKFYLNEDLRTNVVDELFYAPHFSSVPDDIDGFTRNEPTYMGASDVLSSLPVELVSFTYLSHENGITLNWKTKTETNNAGWEIEYRQLTTDNGQQKNTDFRKVGFVAGMGTITEAQNYSFALPFTHNTSQLQFRLKQIDLNGKFTYSSILAVDMKPAKFELLGNYPNPFNPTTNIRFTLPSDSKISLEVFNIIGQKVFNQESEFKAGTILLPFDASKLSSGMYFYSITYNQKSLVKSMMLVK